MDRMVLMEKLATKDTKVVQDNMENRVTQD